jgi:hypothetical protein
MWLCAITGLIWKMNGQMDQLAAPLQLEQAAGSPSDPESQAQAKKIIQEAANKSKRIPEHVLASAGKSFIDTAKSDPTAWTVASTSSIIARH